MIPVILSAGRGSRIGNETKDLPKWFLQIGERHIYDYQLSALSDHFDTVYVILGHGFVEKHDPCELVPDRDDIDVKPLVYEDWEKRENAATAAFAIDQIPHKEDLLLVCGDVIIDSQTISTVISDFQSDLQTSSCSAVAVFQGVQDSKTAVLWDENHYITDYGNIRGHEEAGLFILNEEHISTAYDMWSTKMNDWFPIVFPEVKSKPIKISKKNHLEINTELDLAKARSKLTKINYNKKTGNKHG